MISQTLKFINEVRGSRSLEPLTEIRRGLRSCAGTCPIANSLKDSDEIFVEVSGTTYVVGNSDKMTLPDCAVGFIYEFDNGYLPEYDIGLPN